MNGAAKPTQSFTKINDYINKHFYAEYLEGLKEFVRIPSLSAIFDENWAKNRNLFKQLNHLVKFVKDQKVIGAKIKPIEEKGRSPFLIVDIPAFKRANDFTVLLYGHLDKQPFGEGWNTDPCDPVIKDGLLYGRGSSDDGYSLFAAILAIKACQENGLSHPRCVITIEGSEEGEVDDLKFYMKKYKSELGNPNLVICLDAVALNNSTLFATTTLRGIVAFDLSVTIGTGNMHSGYSGAYPQAYSIMNQLLARIHDEKTQEMHPQFQPKIPAYCIKQTHALARLFPQREELPVLPKLQTKSRKFEGAKDCKEKLETYLNMAWRPQLTVIGIQGLPSDLSKAGNVVVKELKYRCSLRIAPSQDGNKIAKQLEKTLLAKGKDTWNAKIDFEMCDVGNGFVPPDLPPKLNQIVKDASKEVYSGREPVYAGCGGSIPFMEIFSLHFPKANYLLTGACLTTSNPHCANESIDLEYYRKFVTTVSLVLSRI